MGKAYLEKTPPAYQRNWQVLNYGVRRLQIAKIATKVLVWFLEGSIVLPKKGGSGIAVGLRNDFPI